MNLIFPVIFVQATKYLKIIWNFEHFYYISQLFLQLTIILMQWVFFFPSIAFSFSILPISSTIQKMTTTPKNYSAKIDFKIHKSFCTALTVFTHCEIRMHNQHSLGCVRSIYWVFLVVLYSYSIQRLARLRFMQIFLRFFSDSK